MTKDKKNLKNTSDTETGSDTPETIGQKIKDQEAVRAILLEKTETYVIDIAKKAAKEWDEENRFRLRKPETWGRSFFTAAGVTLMIAFLMVAELADRSGSFLQELVHKTLDTNSQVTEALQTESFDQEVLNSIQDYVVSDSADNENPLYALVRRTMKDAPTLVFHGRATFGDVKIFQATNAACEKFFEIYEFSLASAQLDVDEPSSEFDSLPPAVEEDSIDISAICEPSFVMDLQQDVDIPFHARFFNTKRGPGYEVFVILHVFRQQRSGDRKPIDSNSMVRSLSHGVCVLYSPGKRWNQQHSAKDEVLNINSAFEHQGEGLFLAKLSDVVKAVGGGHTPSFQRPRETLHSIALVGIGPKMFATSGESDQELAEREACADVQPNLNQVITLRAMVLVNLAPDDR